MMWSGPSLDRMEAAVKRNMARRKSIQVYDGDGDSERSRILELMQTETNEEILQDLTRRLWHNLKMGPPPPAPEATPPPKPINPTMWAWYWLLVFVVMQAALIIRDFLGGDNTITWIVTMVAGLGVGSYFIVVLGKLSRFAKQTEAHENYKKKVDSWPRENQD